MGGIILNGLQMQWLPLIRLILGSGAIASSEWLTQKLTSNITQRFNISTSRLSDWLQRSPTETKAILQLLLIAGIALPLLPDQALGPWNAINPRNVGYLILLIAGISLVGNFAMQGLGNRVGLLATSAIGGLVSSTAVTLSFARRARSDPNNVELLGAGISLAAAIMALRVLFEVGVVNAKLLPLLLPPLACLLSLIHI